MFGFLRVNRERLDESQTQMYRAHFCAGCHAMVEFGGCLSSLLTNYDLTFWLWMATALEESGGRRLPPTLRPCTAVPFRRVWVHPLQSRVGKAMAALNLALASAKFEDDRRDGERKLLGYAFRSLAKASREALSALDKLGFPTVRITELAALQSTVEADPQASLEDLCAPTRELTGEVFAFLAPLTAQEPLTHPLRELGQRLGRLIYLLDALSDIEKDRKRGAFNALRRSFGDLLPYDAVSRLMHGALQEFERSLKGMPLGQTAAMAQGLVEHLHSLIHKHLQPWKGRKKSTAWGGSRHLALAGFCDGCDACSACGDGCGGCEGCSGCGEGCSSCGSCGEGCSGCGNIGSSCDGAACCCDTADCTCTTCSCCDSCNTSGNTCCCCCGGGPRSKKPKYNVTPEPPAAPGPEAQESDLDPFQRLRQHPEESSKHGHPPQHP